jgi:hypothetical protein
MMAILLTTVIEKAVYRVAHGSGQKSGRVFLVGFGLETLTRPGNSGPTQPALLGLIR